MKKYKMLKSINLWAFPYPERMTLRECMQLAKDAGFDGIELNYDLDNDLSPKFGTKDYENIRKMADEIGIQISGLCSFLFWPYPLTSNDPAKRAQGMELAGKIAQCAHDLGVENVLVVPGGPTGCAVTPARRAQLAASAGLTPCPVSRRMISSRARSARVYRRWWPGRWWTRAA